MVEGRSKNLLMSGKNSEKEITGGIACKSEKGACEKRKKKEEIGGSQKGHLNICTSQRP